MISEMPKITPITTTTTTKTVAEISSPETKMEGLKSVAISSKSYAKCYNLNDLEHKRP